MSSALFSPLNWKELGLLAPAIDRPVRGLFLERVFAPERKRFPQGFLKGEWAFRLSGKSGERTLILSVRTRRPYVYLVEGKGPKPAPQATHSGFDLAISKHLKGARIQSFVALPRERVSLILFDSTPQYALAHFMIPALPELWLLTRATSEEAWTTLARSRNLPIEPLLLPDGKNAPEHLEPRGDWIANCAAVHEAIEKSLEFESFEQRALAAARALKDARKTLEKKLKATRGTLLEANAEPDYRKMGDLLTAVLYTRPQPVDREGKRYWKIVDYSSNEEIELEGQYGFDAKEQADRYFHLARRKQRRLTDGADRAQVLQKNVDRLNRTLEHLPPLLSTPDSWLALESAEAVAGIAPAATPVIAGKKKEGPRLWSGRSFQSKDGLTILVGKSRDENLELTFKVARGNDVWLHVRGRPGAHVLIPVQSGKSTPLETLLDAAVLAVFYSGGESWGKTEVDYTFKKYVKRIRDSTEASYTQNKTLSVEPESERLKRLLKQLE